LLPGLTGLTAFYGVPFVGGIWYSLTDGTFQNNFAGISNYQSVLSNEMFRLGLVNTLIMSLICAPLIWALAFWVAGMLRGMKNTALFRNALLMPYLMPSSAILFIWLIAFDYGGPLNRFITVLGGTRVLWLASGALRAPIALMYLWRNLGFLVIIYTAALQAVPEAYYEYAGLEGAGAFSRWRHVTLPLIAPTAYLVFVFAWLNAFRIFKETYFIGGAYPDMSVYTLQHYMNNMFAKLNYQNVTTAAYSFALLVIALFAALYGLMARSRRGM
jgi:multiple sugar transport system permease protein